MDFAMFFSFDERKTLKNILSLFDFAAVNCAFSSQQLCLCGQKKNTNQIR